MSAKEVSVLILIMEIAKQNPEFQKLKVTTINQVVLSSI